LLKFDNLIRKELHGRSGIYIIKNDINEKVYIGSAIDFYNRLMHHKNSLLNNYSGNIKLSNFVNKYNYDINNFLIELVEFKDKSRDELFEIEKDYILKYDSVENGYNCSYETRVVQIPYTDERRRNVGAKSKGRKFSDESKLKRSIERTGKLEFSGENIGTSKLRNEEVILIKKMLLLEYTPTDIIKLYKNIDVKTIYNIKENTRWGLFIIKKEDVTEEDKLYIENLFKKILEDNKNTPIRSDSKVTLNKVKFIRYLLKNSDDIPKTRKDIKIFYNLKCHTLSSIYLNKNYKTVEAELIEEEYTKWNEHYEKI